MDLLVHLGNILINTVFYTICVMNIFVILRMPGFWKTQFIFLESSNAITTPLPHCKKGQDDK